MKNKIFIISLLFSIILLMSLSLIDVNSQELITGNVVAGNVCSASQVNQNTCSSDGKSRLICTKGATTCVKKDSGIWVAVV